MQQTVPGYTHMERRRLPTARMSRWRWQPPEHLVRIIHLWKAVLLASAALLTQEGGAAVDAEQDADFSGRPRLETHSMHKALSGAHVRDPAV